MFLAAVLLLSLIASSRSVENSVAELSAKQLKKRLFKCSLFDLLVDVRTTSEFNSGHIEGATLIKSLATRDVTTVPELMNCKNCRIAVYCRSGSRAGLAARKLVAAGFTNVSNGGGINDWVGRGYALSLTPSVPISCPTTTCAAAAAAAAAAATTQSLRSSKMCPVSVLYIPVSLQFVPRYMYLHDW
jgi:phage shock protein E